MTNLKNEFMEKSPYYNIDPNYQCAQEVIYTGLLYTESGVETYCQENDVNVVFFHASFFHQLQPFLSESFGTTNFFYPIRFAPWWWEAEMEALIESNQPTIIIEEMVERTIPRLPQTEEQHAIGCC